MHIPDAYLSPATHAVTAGVMLPIWAIAARRTSRELSARQVPLLSLGAAFCFAIQMFNIPAVGGTTAHAVGATLLAILLGPWAAVLVVSLTLGVQALFFGDGGVLAIGANSFNMGLAAPFVGYMVYRLLWGGATGTRRATIAAGVAAYVGSVAAAASTGIMLGIQPLIALDEAGRALYFPFGINVAVPAMVHIHLLVAAPAEAIVTMAALTYLWRNFPEFADQKRVARADKPLRLWAVFLVILLLTPLGLIATGSAWGEWDSETLEKLVGYIPAGIVRFGEGLLNPLIPDYTLPGREGKAWEVLSYILSALVGATLTALIARALVRKPSPSPAAVSPAAQPQYSLPVWLTQSQPVSAEVPPSRGRWLERSLLQLREAIASAIAAEEWARYPGYLQRLHPLAKTVTALCALIAISMARDLLILVAILVGTLLLVIASRLPLRTFALRGLLAILLFGTALSLPLAFHAMTPGKVIWEPFGVNALAISDTGVYAALKLLLRISAAIYVTLLWSVSTRSHLLLQSLRTLRLPRWAVTGLMLTYRYLFSLMETLAEMILARRSRQAGAPTPQQMRAYAGTGAAVLFAKSAALTEDVYLAMQSRGFNGDLRGEYPHGWRWQDTLWCVIALLWIVGAYYFGGWHAG